MLLLCIRCLQFQRAKMFLPNGFTHSRGVSSFIDIYICVSYYFSYVIFIIGTDEAVQKGRFIEKGRFIVNTTHTTYIRMNTTYYLAPGTGFIHRTRAYTISNPANTKVPNKKEHKCSLFGQRSENWADENGSVVRGLHCIVHVSLSMLKVVCRLRPNKNFRLARLVGVSCWRARTAVELRNYALLPSRSVCTSSKSSLMGENIYIYLVPGSTRYYCRTDFIT